MIIRSFFRKATTRIYIILLTVIITIVGILNSYNVYIEKASDEIYYASNLLIITTKEDNYEKLKGDNRIDTVRIGLEFRPTFETDILVESDPNSETPITWEALAYYSNDSILAFSDTYNKVKDNEILLGLDSVLYENSKSILDEYKGKKIKTLFMNKEYEFVIKEVYDASLHPEFIISNEIFNDLKTKITSNIYTAKIKSQKNKEIVRQEYTKLKKDDNDSIRIGVSFGTDKDSSYEKLSEYQSQLKGIKTITILLYMAFIGMYIIISKNIFEDLAVNIKLETILGYKKIELKINMLKRMFSMLLINYILSIILSIILVHILNKQYDLNLIIFNMNYYITIGVIISLFNFLLVLFMNNKSYLKKGRY